MHPILNVSPFALDHPEAKKLYVLLYKTITIPNSIDQRYRMAGGIEPLNTALGASDLVWQDALDKLAKQKRLQKLCQDFKNEGLFPDLIAQIDVVFNVRSAIDMDMISEKIVVLDKLTLRDQLRRLADDDDLLKVIVVRGKSDTGKSWGRHLFTRLAKEKGGIPFYFSQGQGVLQDLFNYLFDLAAPGGSEKIPPKDENKATTDDAWYRQVCSRLAGLALANKKTFWIAVDDLGNDEQGPRLDDDFKNFFNQFVLLMPNDSFRNNFRLMLIHYPEDSDLPARWDASYYEENKTDHTDIEQKHIEDFIQNWYITSGNEFIMDEVIQKAKNVIINAENPAVTDPPLCRLERINKEMKELIKTLPKKMP